MPDPNPVLRDEFVSRLQLIHDHLNLQDAKVDHLTEKQAEAIGWMRGFAVALGIATAAFAIVIPVLLMR